MPGVQVESCEAFSAVVIIAIAARARSSGDLEASHHGCDAMLRFAHGGLMPAGPCGGAG